MSKEIEEWKPIVGYEGEYEVSDWGRVRSLDRYVNTKGNSKRLVKGKILKQWFRDRYLCVGLHHNDFHSVHRLVAEAWIPNPQNKPYVGHTKKLPNGLEDRTANEAWNLQWMTPSENNTFGTRIERALNTRMEKGNLVLKESSKQKISQSLKEYFKENPIPKKLVDQISPIDGEILKTWNSAKEISENLNISESNIRSCCRGKRNNCGGYTFRYWNL